jgi:hypothetical protein
MANLGNYDATGGQTMGERDALPAGEYTAALVKSDRTQAKSNPDNSFIACEFEVMDGEHKGRRFWTNLNLWNGNAQAVDIAQRELNSVMHACGRLRIVETEELHGIPMRVKLGFQKNDATRNEVKGYSPLNGGGNASQQQNHSQANTGGQQASGGAPWKRSA